MINGTMISKATPSEAMTNGTTIGGTMTGAAMNYGQAILTVRDLRIQFVVEQKTIKAVNGVTFSVNRGESLGIVGESGAGKTVLGMSVLGLLPEIARIRSGCITFNNKNLLDLPMRELRKIRGAQISMVFQDPMAYLNPVMPVGSQIIEVLAYHNDRGLSRSQMERLVDEALELVWLPPSRKKDYPHQLSGGMRQRVVIATALICEPELIIADEPTTALDVTTQAQILSTIRELQRNTGTAMILITHDLGIVAHMCDKVAIMYSGEIVEYGTIEDVFQGAIHHPYTVGLLGAIPSLTLEMERLSPVEGLMPDPADLPEGCKFHPRCKSCMDICRKEVPQYYGNGSHLVKCHLYTGQGMEGGGLLG